MRESYISCICNSLGSHETYHCLYGKNQRCSRSGFRFVKKNHFTESIIRKHGAEFEGKRMSEKMKMVIVQYLLMHLSVEAISSKVKHFTVI